MRRNEHRVGRISQPLAELSLRNFRCLEAADFEFHPELNLFTGGNGAGKTSILEAIYFLGRGRSFRAADQRNLIRSGCPAAEIGGLAGGITVGVHIAATGLDIRVAGQPGGKIADLVSALPVQAIDADIASMAQGPPEPRRRLLDWGVFHVEHGYLPCWRQYRRALLQRNAVLRDGGPDELLDAWDPELARAGEALEAFRQQHIAELCIQFNEAGQKLLGMEVSLRYQRGWGGEGSLADVLRAGRTTDRGIGYTRHGPHRADVQFDISSERARWRASKGQQKLLAAAMILSQCHVVSRRLGRTVALTVDEPAADLDDAHLSRFLAALAHCPAQVFLAAIHADGLRLHSAARAFHVEHGKSKALL